ncbi:hypothetical protein ACSFE6_04805 [Pseudomonas baetica]|uniref:hypothetical protein n=1 Tax=Pseudomonas baetica TaxID=674054 RepID=UPI003EEA6B3E
MTIPHIDRVMSVSVWGWLLAACFVVMMFCVYMAFDAHITLNKYQSEREQDMSRYRAELVQALDRQSEALKARIDSSSTQLKQYVDIQVPLQMKNYVPPITNIRNSANAHGEVRQQ